MSCRYCGTKTTKFQPVLISDIEYPCQWCPEEYCNYHHGNCNGIGYSEVPLNYCPNCGGALKSRFHGDIVGK